MHNRSQVVYRIFRLLLVFTLITGTKAAWCQNPGNRLNEHTEFSSRNVGLLNSYFRKSGSANNNLRQVISTNKSFSVKQNFSTLFNSHVSKLQRSLPSPSSPLATVCYIISGRDFLQQDSLILYGSDPVMTRDGNVVTSGQFAVYGPFAGSGGFCMKTDIQGNVIWSKLYDSAANIDFNYINFLKAIELRDGSILLAGRTTNHVSGNDDFVLTKLDGGGNQIWFKTYQSRFWQGFSGSGDYFDLRGLDEDPLTGDVYFTGQHWEGLATVTRVDPMDGQVIWSNGYRYWNTDNAFGIVPSVAGLTLFQMQYDSNNDSYISVSSLDRSTGDTIACKHLRQTGDLYGPRFYTTYSVTKLLNGHYLMSGPTTGFYEYPVYTGTVDLYHAAVVELDNNFDFVKAYGFRNRISGNGSNTKISTFPDGSGVFTMLDVFSSFTAEAHVSVFRDDRIYHQRKRIHTNEGIPYEPGTIQLTDGGYLNIKLMGDSTVSQGSHIDFYRMHSTDTASLCMGLKDSTTSIWHLGYEPATREMKTLERNVFSESRPKTITTWDFRTSHAPACQVISYCDTFSVSTDKTTICEGNSVQLTVHKNTRCNGLVPFSFDTTRVSTVVRVNDSTWSFGFTKPGNTTIVASLMGCKLSEDTVEIVVLPAKANVNLGPDSVICPGNKIVLNASAGYATYAWQDGSTDSVFTVTGEGKYFITVMNGCGDYYSDTVNVSPHPAIPFSAGVDRVKCNNDTVRLTADAGFLNYTWSPAYNISALNTANVIVNPSVDTSYFVTAEKTPGCFAFDTVRIKVNNSSPISLGRDTSICRNDSVRLDVGSGFISYNWSTGEQQPFIDIKVPGKYSVIATASNGCSSKDTFNLIALYILPDPDLGPDSLICRGQQRILRPRGAYVSWVWNTAEITPSITVNAPGSYSVMVTDSHGCVAADTTVVVGVAEIPSSFLGRDTVICSYTDLTLSPNTGFIRYQWYDFSTVSTITIKTPGIYWLEVTDYNNCHGRDTIAVGLKDCMTGIFVPSAFTPDGNGLNDLFRPRLFGDIRYFNFKVYNRWGEIVFQSSTPGTGWDGTFKGRKLDTNEFFWICSYQLGNQKIEQRKGNVLLIR